MILFSIEFDNNRCIIYMYHLLEGKIMLDKRKVVIIGAGHVGSHVAMALCFQGTCDSIY